MKKRYIILIITLSILIIGMLYFIFKINSQKFSIKYEPVIEEKPIEKKEEIITYKEELLNGAYPEIEQNMIPVYYENGWKKANTEKEWYSYEKLNWANVIVPKNELLDYYKNLENDSLINLEDVLGFFVWVPRYEYKLFNVDNKRVKEQTIEINFVNKDTEKKTEIQNGLFYTHPAFSTDEGELNGFWIAKFEPSLEENIVKILPGKKTLVNINTKDMWDYAFGITNSYKLENQSRMITNMEWGAIAYLSYSDYSKQSNPNYKDLNKRIFINSAAGNDTTWDNVTTGCSSGRISGASSYKCPYAYDVDYYGTGASSTGTIYGIYDLAGGSWECVMGIISEYPVNDNLAGYKGALPTNKRYYTLYKEGSMNDYKRGLIGDATRETLSSTVEDKSWNNNLAYFATKSFPFIKRGGTFRGGSFSGLFDYGITDALPRGDKTFRVIISKY